MARASDILARCDQKATPLKEALRRYADGNPAAPRAIRADLDLYVQATRTYLAWSAGLLKALEDVCASRPCAGSAVGELVTRCAAYFDSPGRWPQVPAMDLPLRLMIPAYYTARAAQHVSCLFHPHLLDADLTRAHAFATEVLGQPAADAVCRCKNADLRQLPRAEDEADDVVPLHYRSFPSSRMESQLALARTAPPPPPPTPTPTSTSSVAPAAVAPSAVQPDSNPINDQLWVRRLADTRIVLQRDNAFDSGYSGGYYSSRESLLDLHANLRYQWIESSFTRVSIPGMSIGGPSSREVRGTWRVATSGSSVSLVLTDDDGERTSLSLEPSGSGELMVDGRRRAWERL
jgi:hypothetical protein